MTYAETLNYLYNTLPMFSRMGSAAFKKDLTNIIALCKHLGNPHLKFKTIHVAGTNGKGSVSHMMAAVLQKAGYKTGLYTSPHLYDFRERIRINGAMVSEAFVVNFTERIKPLAEEIQPSFFEITVAMAFELFAKEKVDVAVIEVGLGGRLDSTNIITPELSIINNIGWDHMNMLGNTLAEIAAEKAGIIKENIPVVIGEGLPETKTVFEEVASQKNSSIYYAESSLKEVDHRTSPAFLRVSYKADNNSTISIETDLPGLYQVKNLRTVLTAVAVLRGLGWHLPDEAVQPALKNVKQTTGLQGRWELLRQHPTVILDVAHNRNGIEEMLRHLAELSFNALHIVIGTVKDKDLDGILSRLPAEANYYFAQAQIARALPADELRRKAEVWHLVGESYTNVNAALNASLEKAASGDLILVCGSIFLVAEVDRKIFTDKQ